MSFVSLGGDGSARPTFFELVAVERLLPSLKAATIYSLSVFAQRRHALHRLLSYEDELFALVSFVLDRQGLASGSATFADGLYGLRRAPYTDDGSPPGVLDRRQQRLALLLQVGLPYLQAKLSALYERHAAGDPALDLGISSRQEEQMVRGSGLSRRQQWLLQCRRWALAVFLRGWPFAHAATEGLKFCYQLMYLLDSTPYYSPALHLLRQHIVRVSGQELMKADQEKARSRNGQLRRAREAAWPGSLLTRAFLHASYVFADHSRNALILSVFAFKLLEWWFTSAEQKLSSQRKLPAPPPPPAVPPSPEGVPLPTDPADCPLCRRPRTNPAMAVPSGYVFCYPCIFGHVSRAGSCPVTRLPTTIDQIRRLFYSQ